MDAYDVYKQEVPKPHANGLWLLHGVGMEAFQYAEEDLPVPGADEILMRVDAVSICFSDVKLIRAGNKHPRVLIPLEQRPTVPGIGSASRIGQSPQPPAERRCPVHRAAIDT